MLRTDIEDPPVIIKILNHLGLPTRAPPRAPARRVDLFQTIGQPKTTCQRKPTAPLALNSSERRHKKSFAHLPTALRPSRPAQKWVSHQPETGIDNSPGPAL